MTPHRKNVLTRDWFETNSRHQKSYSKGGKKIRGCRGLLGRVVSGEKVSLLSYSSTRNNDPIAISLDRKYIESKTSDNDC